MFISQARKIKSIGRETDPDATPSSSKDVLLLQEENLGHTISRKTNSGYWPVDRNVGHVCRVAAEIQGIFKVLLYNGRY